LVSVIVVWVADTLWKPPIALLAPKQVKGSTKDAGMHKPRRPLGVLIGTKVVAEMAPKNISAGIIDFVEHQRTMLANDLLPSLTGALGAKVVDNSTYCSEVFK
jgi:hypothetical protein